MFAMSLNLDQSKILSSGKGLNPKLNPPPHFLSSFQNDKISCPNQNGSQLKVYSCSNGETSFL